MSHNVRTTAQPAARTAVTRILLLLPPLALGVAALILLVVSPFSWGAAEVLNAPAWMPPVLGALTALGGLAVALYSLRKTLRTTRGDFEVFALQLVFGVLMFISGAAMLVSLAVQLPDPSLYTRFLDENGEYTLSPLGFFVVSLVMGAFNIGWVWAGAYLYSHAVADMEPNRISRRSPTEVDGVGQLLREHR